MRGVEVTPPLLPYVRLLEGRPNRVRMERVVGALSSRGGWPVRRSTTMW
ncbi:MAG: hypothetical protein V3U31_00635 [Dehalococcoidia bacterium]